MLFKKSLLTLALAVAAMVCASPVLQRRTLGGGISDFKCKPTAAHPYPVVLLHGLGGNALEWSYMAGRLALEGYCTFPLNYGFVPKIPMLGGLDDMKKSGQAVAEFVDQVLAATGAPKVDIVGHSEGSLLMRGYLKFNGGRAKTHSVAGIGSVAYGSNVQGMIDFAYKHGLADPLTKIVRPLCKACIQVVVRSDYIAELNAGGDAFPDINYLMITSKTDELVTPYTNGFLRTTGPNVHNVATQDLCPFDHQGHISQATDPIVYNAIEAFFRTNDIQGVDCKSLVQ
ncbi:hypothetical protein BGZ75_009910 [Mortierella antarctica]|nr:hypothetical protein BGZ75_009910 [Mortierella antarctica]